MKTQTRGVIQFSSDEKLGQICLQLQTTYSEVSIHEVILATESFSL